MNSKKARRPLFHLDAHKQKENRDDNDEPFTPLLLLVCHSTAFFISLSFAAVLLAAFAFIYRSFFFMFAFSRLDKFLWSVLCSSLLFWFYALDHLSRHVILDPASLASTTMSLSSALSSAAWVSPPRRATDSLTTADLPAVLAIYFPQFHPDPLNDRLWEPNFTDWNSLQAAPETNRLGLKIPRPLDGTYYDLRDTAARKRQ